MWFLVSDNRVFHRYFLKNFTNFRQDIFLQNPILSLSKRLKSIDNKKSCPKTILNGAFLYKNNTEEMLIFSRSIMEIHDHGLSPMLMQNS